MQTTERLSIEEDAIYGTPESYANPVLAEVDAEVARGIAALDLDAIEREFRSQGEFIFVPELLTASLRERLAGESQKFAPEDIRRMRVPFARKGGSVTQADVAAKSPHLDAFYHSPSLVRLIQRLAGKDLVTKAPEDGHGATLLFYDRAGDYCAHHYDGCGCEAGENFTMTLGLRHRCAPHSEFELFSRDKERPSKKITLALEPGSAVFYRGDRIFHGVSPMAAGEERVVYSLTYSRLTARPAGFRALSHKVNDFLMFGLGYVFRRT